MAGVPLNDNTPLNKYTATAGQTVFPYTFWVEAAEDLDVYVNDVLKTLDTDYTVDVVQDDDGGNVTFTSGRSLSDKVTITRSTAMDQLTGYTPGGDFDSTGLNLRFARVIAMLQEVLKNLTRSVRLTQSDQYSGDLYLPTASAGKCLKWNADADGFENSTYDPDEQEALAAAQVTLAAAQVTLATAQATAAASSATDADASATDSATSATAAASSATDAASSATDAAASAAAAAASEAALNLRTIVNSSANYTVVAADKNKLIEYTGTGGHSIFLTAAATLGSGFEFHVKNAGSGDVTIDPNGAETIDGSATITLTSEQSVVVVCDGSNFQVTQSRGYGTGSGTVSSVDASNGVKVSGGGPLTATGTIIGAMSVASKSSAYTVIAGDRGSVLVCTGTWTLGLTAAATLASDFFFHVRNDGTGIITIDPNGAETIDGNTTIKVYQGESFTVACDGTGFKTIGRRKGPVLIDLKSASGSTSLDFTTGFADAEFFDYEFHLSRIVCATNTTDLWLRVTEDGGSTWKAGASDYKYNGKASNTSSTWGASESTGDTKIILARSMGNTTAQPLDGTIRFAAPTDTNAPKAFLYDTYNFASAQLERIYGYGYYKTDNGAINGARFLMSSGNLTSGSIALYGVRK